MNTLLIAVNAKYIHSNPAVYSLRAYAKGCPGRVEIAEYTINQPREQVLADIYRRKPDVAAFSCYLWNIEYVRALIPELAAVLPEVRIWAGGPEVSYDSERFLREVPETELVMNGEGEAVFRKLLLAGETGWESVPGITRRLPGGEALANPPEPLLPMDEIPFPYRDLKAFENRIVYYESSRGCPFSCSYCMSSIEKTVRLRSLEKVERELAFFLENRVPQVKFVDRTFNCSHTHAMGIWRYIRDHDNGVTNFHFEIAGDLLTEEELALLAGMRPGLVQLEIGVQSTNPDTLAAVRRKTDLKRLAKTAERIRKAGNIHQHLDLIAGLPMEDLESFRRSFNQVYAMKPQQLQLGFLKVLKGSEMYRRAREFGIVYRRLPPYEVLSTPWLSYGELLELKSVEEMVEIYYNSSQYSHTIEYLETLFSDAYSLYSALGSFYLEKGYQGMNQSRMGRIEILRSFARKLHGCRMEECEERLLYDLYARENSKSRPDWAPDLSDKKDAVYAFYQKEAEEKRYLKRQEPVRKLLHESHVEIFRSGRWLLFDYRNRDPLTGNAAVWDVTPAGGT